MVFVMLPIHIEWLASTVPSVLFLARGLRRDCWNLGRDGEWKFRNSRDSFDLLSSWVLECHVFFLGGGGCNQTSL